MRSVIVQVPGLADPIGLRPGDSVTFGRGGGGLDVDIVVAGCGVSRLAGAVRACDDFWLISNYSSHSTYVIRNPQGAGEFVKLAPRRLEMPVPFEFADVMLPVDGEEPVFRVLAPGTRTRIRISCPARTVSRPWPSSRSIRRPGIS